MADVVAELRRRGIRVSVEAAVELALQDPHVSVPAAAAMIFELLAGRPLVEGAPLPSLAALRGDVPAELDAIIARAAANGYDAASFRSALDAVIPPARRAGSASILSGEPKELSLRSKLVVLFFVGAGLGVIARLLWAGF